MAIQTVTDSNFDELLQQEMVLVDFWAAWCGPCRMLAPVLADVDQETGGRLTIAKVNVDDYGQLASQFDVMSIPTLILFKEGAPVEKIVGFQSKQALLSLIQPHLS